MNKDEYNFATISKEYLTISIEPDIHLSDNEQIHLNKCFSHLSDISYISLVLNCTFLFFSSISNSTNVNCKSIRINHYLRVRQSRKFYSIHNIKQIYLNLHLSTNKIEQITANLIEFDSCKTFTLFNSNNN
jgi:hypothetical protein